MSSMDINEIMAYLPHRFPFLLVDRVLSLEPGKNIVALKNVSMNEPFFPGHFPKHPVMPGVLILEALAQAAALLSFKTVADTPSDDAVVYFAGIDGARFKKPVMPGDQLMLHVEILRNLKGIWKYATYAEVDGQRVAEAEMMATLR
ncbi:3-hydroxyacyl-[acyl-carrier-protein] dehydratase FabZ [Sulfuriferula plumbiphila]|uniref:3-hydroxyacyl-[acyl-carrier-protein] dehydratase FabZ n=1 Tax=Sulfuriferula plumbiphila TaxID=171865 RepID=A0A512L8E7_9PROT|nr:3-hydroxyacyl-ACP dehydratase FabZ [Sulfuriferula plumbiphila]BBP05040.1 3-hydroxyacyl-[acyl-carrier-protein] dehydratase FabZ [Sulfuriferula plumbiphila]GEP30748.1 3-hydroxyacyl-[acyl-carrier-protein] dehydratase FabZ [Sulfuriferula plumbiphila]